MAQPTTAKRVRGEQFIKKVFESVAAEVARIGHQDISIEEVAARAGVNKTSIYRRWVTPERLVLDMFERGSAAGYDPHDTGSLRGDLLVHITHFTRLRHDPVSLAVVRMALTSAFKGELRRFLETLLERERVDIARMFERGIVRGELPRGASPELGYRLVHGLMMELTLSDRPERDAKEGRAAVHRVETLIEIIISGLANLALRDAARA